MMQHAKIPWRRVLRAFGSGLVLFALMGGTPWFLTLVGDPGFLLRANWSTIVLVNADSRLWLALLALIGWAAWLLLMVTILLEVVSVMSRQRITVSLPGTDWLRPAISTLVTGVLLVPSTAMAHADPAPPVTVQQQNIAPVAEPQQTGSAHNQAQEKQTAERYRTYTVQAGDELWSIAEKQLGSGDRWREIATLNPSLTDQHRLAAGLVLKLPHTETRATVTVRKGDTLWHLAGKHLGDPLRWPEIHRLNRDKLPDPDKLEIGTVLALPAAHGGTISQPVSPDKPSVEVSDIATKESDTSASETLAPDKAVEQETTSQFEPAELVSTTDQHSAENQQSVAQPSPYETLHTAGFTDEAGWLVTLGSGLLAGLVAATVIRRRLQLLERPLGHRLVSLTSGNEALFTAMAKSFPEPEDLSAASPSVIGWTKDDDPVTLDLAAEKLTVFLGDDTRSALAALVTVLSCSAQGPAVVLPGDSQWAAAFDDPRISALPDTAAGILELTRMVAERRMNLAHRSLTELQADPDLAERWQPVVFVFLIELSAAQLAEISQALTLGEVGISVVCSAPESVPGAATIRCEADHATLNEVTFIPQRLPEPARRAVVDLLHQSLQPSEPAPWWPNEELPTNVHALPLPAPFHHQESAMTSWDSTPVHPRLLLLGDVELIGASGTRPSRAVGQCLEYCAWLLERPGSTATTMTRSLLVAETTRRSNMSRLRSWLGRDQDGKQYLPEAYSGKIALDPRVSSDWDRFQSLLLGGIPHASTEALREALSLVRGAPLGATWFQWPWAEQLRVDMISMIVDAACVLADRAIEAGDLPTALWAIEQGLRTGEEFDQLTVRRIHALSLDGQTEAVEEAVVALNRATRGAGRDLAPELGHRVQEALRLIRPPRAAQG